MLLSSQDHLPAEVAQSTCRQERTNLPGWSVLDRRVIHGSAPSSSSTAATAKTSNDKEVRVSIRFARPPLASYVELQTNDYVHALPRVVSAHEDLLLIYAVVAYRGAHSSNCPGNFFVYNSDPDRPWLKRLPMILGKQWLGRGRTTGVYRKGDGFYVASLQSVVDSDGEEVAELFCYSSYMKKWKYFRLECLPDLENGFDPKCWRTDNVFSFGMQIIIREWFTVM
jgi:hypothetical protein